MVYQGTQRQARIRAARCGQAARWVPIDDDEGWSGVRRRRRWRVCRGTICVTWAAGGDSSDGRESAADGAMARGFKSKRRPFHSQSIQSGITGDGTSISSGNYGSKEKDISALSRQRGPPTDDLLRLSQMSSELFGRVDVVIKYVMEGHDKGVSWAINEKQKAGGSGMITTSDLLLGVWFFGDSPGHTILVNLGFDAEKIEQLKYLSSQPGFDEW
ncbi:hypothetical protein Droror1_Dr00017501 [Drosera rotundifolia]